MSRRFKTWTDLLMSGADFQPDEVAFSVIKDGSGGAQITRRKFVDSALRVANGFQQRGVQKHSVVVLRGEPSVNWAIAFAGVLLAGGMPSPIHGRATKAELVRAVQIAGAGFAVVTSDGGKPNISREDTDAEILTFDRVASEVASIEGMLDLDPISPVECEETDPAVVMQTSGTTGHPKCVVHTHASHLEFIDSWTRGTMVEGDRALSFLPLNHQGGLLLGWLSAYAMGVPYYQLEPYTLEGLWDAIHKLEITWAALIAPVPTYMLAAEPRSDDRSHKLRFVAGSRRPEEVPEMDRRFGIQLVRSYGSTETTIVAMSTAHDRPQVHGLSLEEAAACAGPAMPGFAYRIMSDDEHELPHLAVGNLQVRGPGLFSHYLNNEEATARAFTDDGWFRTGDRAYVNNHGELFFVERAGNAIRRSGENISAAEIEATIIQHPAVHDVAVVGVPDKLRGQEIRACIETEPGCTVTASDIFEHCKATLAKFKVPRYVDFWEALPRTSTMKISRGQLTSDPASWVDRFEKA